MLSVGILISKCGESVVYADRVTYARVATKVIPYPIRMIHLSKITCVCRTASIAALTNTAPEDLNAAMEGLSEALEDM